MLGKGGNMPYNVRTRVAIKGALSLPEPSMAKIPRPLSGRFLWNAVRSCYSW